MQAVVVAQEHPHLASLSQIKVVERACRDHPPLNQAVIAVKAHHYQPFMEQLMVVAQVHPYHPSLL